MALRTLENLSRGNNDNCGLMKEGIPLIKYAIENYPEDASVQGEAFRVLKNLSANNDNCILMIEAGVFELIKSPMTIQNHPQSEKVQGYSQKILQNLNNGNKGLIVLKNEMDLTDKSDQDERFYQKQSENINDSLNYKSVLEMLSKFNPILGCKEAVLTLQNQIGVTNLKKIANDCEKWMESFLSSPKNNYLNLSWDEIFAIALYTYDLGYGYPTTDNFYSILNRMLQNRQQMEMEQWAPYLYYLQSALSKFPDEEKVVYRGIRGVENVKLIEKEYTTTRKIHWSGYSSTTTKLSVAENFARKDGVIMEISIFSGKNISSYAMIQKEEEVLLSPNMSFTVMKECFQERDQKYLNLQQNENKNTFVF